MKTPIECSYRGLYFPSRVLMFMKSGGYSDGAGAGKPHSQITIPEQDSLQINDIAFSGVEGPEDPLAPVHELMHRGYRRSYSRAYPEEDAAKINRRRSRFCIMHHMISLMYNMFYLRLCLRVEAIDTLRARQT